MEISEGQISNLEDQNVEISQNRGEEKYIIIKKKKKEMRKNLRIKKGAIKDGQQPLRNSKKNN